MPVTFEVVHALNQYPEHGVTFVKYCSILLQVLTVQADEDFLFALYDLTKLKGASWNAEQEEYAATGHWMW